VFQAENGVLDTCNQGPGVKQQLLNASGGFELAAIVSLSFPEGRLESRAMATVLPCKLPWWRPLSANWTAALKMAPTGWSASPPFLWIDS
jgi:hypothetical protein